MRHDDIHYREAIESSYHIDTSLATGYYSANALARTKGYSSVEHLAENYTVIWNETKDGIIWNVQSCPAEYGI